MANLVVNIDPKVKKYITTNSMDIYKLFNIFGIDLNYLLKEKEYNKEFINSLEKGDFTISNSF